MARSRRALTSRRLVNTSDEPAGGAARPSRTSSAFDHAALGILLERLSVDRLCLIGSATEGCVVRTDIDARELGVKTTIIADACASTDPDLEKTALEYAERVVGARIRRGRDLGVAES